ncbi:hypothetical protein SNEBB_008776 [Seison nebaliae]|nr:hypothetical protein SNEBB_008776 [Seison nebaliae]
MDQFQFDLLKIIAIIYLSLIVSSLCMSDDEEDILAFQYFTEHFQYRWKGLDQYRAQLKIPTAGIAVKGISNVYRERRGEYSLINDPILDMVSILKYRDSDEL